MRGVPGAHATAAERDRFVLAQRPPRRRHDPWRHQGVLVEPERAADGRIVRVATIFLTGRECPWRCVMCDLWQHTIEEDTPPARSSTSSMTRWRRCTQASGAEQ